jgi:hypothetical protein
MNEPGEPNMGNPSVRFDEGRERVGHWPECLFNPTSPAYSTIIRMGGVGKTVCASQSSLIKANQVLRQ